MRLLVAAAAAGLLIGHWVSAADVHAATRVATDIPPQDLGSALQVLAKERGFQVVFVAKDLERLRTAGAKGELTSEEALARLLQGTGFTYQYLGADGVSIVPVAHGESANLGSRVDGIRLVQSAGQSGSSGVESKDPRALQGRLDSADPSANSTQPDSNEIIVTAQKREERAFDVPMSIMALSGEELRRRKLTSLDDLALAVPGMGIQSNGSTRRLALRGLSNVSGGWAQVGIYLDEASATMGSVTGLDVRTYDLERVEVLRGPQGTLYGEGALGGTIRFITKDPRLDAFGMSADAAALFTEDGAPGQRVEAAFNAPLKRDELGLRIAGVFDRQGGWVDQPAAGRKDINDQSLAEVRIKGLWRPAANMTASVMAIVHRNDGSPNNGEDDDGNYTQLFGLTTTPSLQDDYELSNLTLTYDLSRARLLSTTSYIDQDRSLKNYGTALQLTAPPAPPSHVLYEVLPRHTRVFTQELRATSASAGPWQWTVGAIYRDFQTSTDALFRFGAPPPAPLPAAFRSQARTESTSWALFADTSYKLGRLTLGAGLRYFEDDQEQATGAAAFGPTLSATFTSRNPRLYAKFDLTEGVNVYASAAKGFRSGGFNPVNRPPFDPESVWTYELGAKMLADDRRVTADAAVFYSDYVDYQIFGTLPPPSPPLTITSNAGSAKVKGVEWNFGWRPLDRWTFELNGNYLDTRFYEINVLSSAYQVGDPLDLIPKYMVTVSTQRDFSFASKPAFARLDYSRQGRSTYRNRNIGGPSPWYYNESDLIDMLGFNLGVQWNSRLSLSLFGQNLLDERGFLDAFSMDRNAPRARPRTFGIGFGVTFD